MNGATKLQKERERYISAFNDTMVRIWKERIALLGVFDTGALYNSVGAVSMTADGKFISAEFVQRFNLYGLFVDYGSGSNTPLGNSGDLGEGYTNKRVRRRWFSTKYYRSVKNIQEFMADNLGQQCVHVIADSLHRK